MTTPILELDEWTEAQAQPHVTVNEAIRWLECFASLSVLSITTTDPPMTPAEGDRYIVPAAGATGDWAGHDDEVALWFGTAWGFKLAPTGAIAYVEDEGVPYRYNGGWSEEIDETGGGGGGGAVAQRYMITASFDTANPQAPRFRVPLGGEMMVWALHAEGGPGDAVVDIRRSDAGLNNPPSGPGDSICGGSPPFLSGDVGRESDCTDFSNRFCGGGDVLEFVLVSFDTNITALHFQLAIDPDTP